MKKVLITLALVCLAMVANAQFVLGVDASVNVQNTNSSANIQYYKTATHDTNFTNNLIKQKSVGFSVALRAGYQFNRARVGLGFGYGTTTLTNHVFVDSLPKLESWMKQTFSVISGLLYFRYNVIEIGDISIFAELDGTLSITPNVKNHVYSNQLALLSGDNKDVIDTTYNGDTKITAFSVSVVPGVSWQISPYCSLDLYIDLLRIGYAYSKTSVIQETPSFNDKKDKTETTTTDSQFVFGCQMSPNSLFNDLSLFRLGFNLSF